MRLKASYSILLVLLHHLNFKMTIIDVINYITASYEFN